MNIPMSIVLFSAICILFDKVEFHWKVQTRPRTFLSYFEKKQISLNDARLCTKLPPAKWKSKIGSPVVEAAMNDFVEKLLKDFLVDLVYSNITPDKEFPDQLHALIMDALGEISARVKEINLVDLLTRYLIYLLNFSYIFLEERKRFNEHLLFILGMIIDRILGRLLSYYVLCF